MLASSMLDLQRGKVSVENSEKSRDYVSLKISFRQRAMIPNHFEPKMNQFETSIRKNES